jgi:CDP-diacylglycerol--glycerol-3-phosphate 3-phosphatidyltransferase
MAGHWGVSGMYEGLYRTKPAAHRLIEPLVDACVRRGISADTLTLAAVPVAALGGICLALSDDLPVALLAVPALAALRLVLNLIDGQVARRTGSAHPWGEVLNELGDRVADVVFIGGLAFVVAVGPLLALSAVIAALLASYAGIVARATGAPRGYGGVMSKPGRMTALAVAAPLAFLLGQGWPLWMASWLILVGSLITLAQRLRTARRWHEHERHVDASGGPDGGAA